MITGEYSNLTKFPDSELIEILKTTQILSHISKIAMEVMEIIRRIRILLTLAIMVIVDGFQRNDFFVIISLLNFNNYSLKF